MTEILSEVQSADSCVEPAWLLERRKAAQAHFDALPMPSAQAENWRFSSVGRLSIDGFATPDQAPDAHLRQACVEQSSLLTKTSGQSIFIDDQLLEFEALPEELAQKGVRYLSLAAAIAENPEWLESHFLTMSPDLGSEKFAALHAANTRAGTVLYVPAGVVVPQPIVNTYWISREGLAVYPHTLIIAAANSQVSVVDVYRSQSDESAAVNLAACNLYAGDGAQVTRHVVQACNEATISFQLDSTLAQRNAQVSNCALNIGAARARYEQQTQIDGPGAHVKMNSLSIAEGQQELDQRTLQVHNAPNAVSDLLYKNALLDRSRTIFSGLIKVAEGAQQTDAYQTNRNLLLDPRAEANALPGLEILANDVKCSHGATTGNVDAAQLFYMMSRGIDERTAMKLLVFGFFEEIIEQTANEELAAGLRQFIQEKFESKI